MVDRALSLLDRRRATRGGRGRSLLPGPARAVLPRRLHAGVDGARHISITEVWSLRSLRFRQRRGSRHSLRARGAPLVDGAEPSDSLLPPAVERLTMGGLSALRRLVA